MALFGMVDTGEGQVSITLPEWMSKEMVEMFVGGFVGGLASGAIAGAIKTAGNLQGTSAALTDVLINGLTSFFAYKMAGRGEFKNFAFGAMLITGFMAMTGLVNLILSVANVKAQMLAPWEAHSIGESAIVKVFGAPTTTPQAVTTVVVQPQPIPKKIGTQPVATTGGAEIY